MWVATRDRWLGVSLVVIAALFGRARADCSVDVPEGNWKPAAAHRAVLAGSPDVSVPSAIDGFNRTVKLDGGCSDLPSQKFESSTPSSKGELLAIATGETGMRLTWGSMDAALQGIAVFRRSAADDDAIGIRFQFENADTKTFADLELDLKEDDAGETQNLVSWLRTVHNMQTTTPQPVVNVSVSLEFKRVPLGNGTCNGTVNRKFETEYVPTARQCEGLCQGSIKKHFGLPAEQRRGLMCVGYAYNPDAKGDEPACITYRGGPLSAVNASGAGGFNCFGELAKDISSHSSTPQPEQVEDQAQVLLKIESTLLNGLDAVLQEVSPPKDAESCFDKVSHFEARDEDDARVALPINSEDWEDLISILPKVENMTNATAPGSVVMDRLIFLTCGGDEVWSSSSGTNKACPPPTVDCRSNSTGYIFMPILTGLFTSTLAWIAVYIVFQLLGQPTESAGKFTQSGKMYSSLNEQPSGTSSTPICTQMMVIILLIVALLVAALVGYVMSYITDSLLVTDSTDEDSECSNYPNDVWIVAYACGVGAWTAVGVGILYLWMVSRARTPVNPDSKHILCRMQDGENGQEVAEVWEVDRLQQRLPMMSAKGYMHDPYNSD